jgi:thiol-disulfide isomerase/thioredoxin
MLAFDVFHAALSYDDFFAKFGSPGDKDRWDRTRAAVALTDAQRQLLAAFKRQTHVLVLAGAWCGDCASQCPIFERFAEAAPTLRVRYLDRDAHADAQRELQINGGNRVPVVVFFSEDGHEVARYGERTLSAYRRMARDLVPGLPPVVDPLAEAVADWLREFERVQWVLRLSPRLRRLHQD